MYFPNPNQMDISLQLA
uniref:Uncharacterized protein n=1 Tax=Arundo donax TaxID=35708 RepID=A0A0A8ZQE5_ARUDO